MTKSHDPSTKPVAHGQIGKFFAQLRLQLQKLSLKSKLFEEARKRYGKEMAAECAAVVQKYVDMVSNTIVHYVSVDRARSTLDALKACGRVLYVNEEVAATAPRGTGKKAKMTYFTPRPECYVNGVLSCQKLDEEYKFHRLVVDLQAQADDNAEKPEFTDTKRNACQWKDKDGNWCYAAFRRWRGEPLVNVYRLAYGWYDLWSFGGVPDESSASAV